MLTAPFGRVETWHSGRFVRPWLGPLPMTRGLILAAVVFALIAVFANVKVRYDQGQIWKANPEITTIAGAMSFSSADAPYFLGHAAAAKDGLAPDEYLRKRAYPNAEIMYQQRADNAPAAKRPLLSTLISWLAPSSSPGDLLTAAHTILLASAGMTALMIILTFGAAGYWLEGTVAAIGGGLSSAYLGRSSFGRIDTDQLNLGLMYLMFGLVMMSARSRTILATLLWCIAAGATASIFMAWYGKSELIWMAMAAYFWLLIILQRNVPTTALCILLFYVFAPVTLPNPFESIYVQPNIVRGDFLFPNTLDTITEVARSSKADILVRAAGSVEMGLVCLTGLTLWAARHPIMAIAYGPLAAFAILNFLIGNRAVFYSAPIFWFGAAFLMTSAARFVTEAISSQPNTVTHTRRVSSPVSIAVVSLSLVIAWVNTPTGYVPRPSFPKPVLEGLVELENIAESHASVVATWWDYGYASLFLNKIPTLHDGGSQTGPATHFFAQALLKADQTQTVRTLQFLTSQSIKDIQQYSSRAALFDDFNQPADGHVPDIYLIFTSQMDGWISTISLLGNWDIETGKPIVLTENNGASHVEYIGLGCNYRRFPSAIACGNDSFDFDRGLMNNAPVITGWTRARGGFAEDVRQYHENAPFGVQTLQINNRLASQLMHRQLYDSSYNKLFHLGLVEAPGVTLVYDDYPHIRIYKITGQE
jgi:dolichyl-diphosphooligosaccharide--protein glycosyltransferase